MKTKARLLKLTAVAFFIALFCSCLHVKLVGDYDEITDRKLTEMQLNFALHFNKLERVITTEKADYSHYIEFYDLVKAEVDVLKIRAAAIAKNKIVIEQLKLLDSNISDLMLLHQIGFSSAKEISLLKSAFDEAFGAMIFYQINLKRRKKN